MPRKPSDILHMQIRMSEALRRQLAKAAKETGRSMNAEMVWRLAKSFGDDQPKQLPAELRSVLDMTREEADEHFRKIAREEIEKGKKR